MLQMDVYEYQFDLKPYISVCYESLSVRYWTFTYWY